MRLLFVLAVALPLLGCSAGMPYMPNIALNPATESLSPNYLQILRDYLGPADIQVSQPLRVNAWDVNDPGQWYVCTRDKKGREEAYAFSGDRIAGKVIRPRPDSLLNAMPNPTDVTPTNAAAIDVRRLDEKRLAGFCNEAVYATLAVRPEVGL